MEKKQWVQHISGVGEKWRVSGKLYNQEDHNDWQVTAKNDTSPFNYHYLPKSEYRLCDPPEVWKDITEFIEPSCTPGNWINSCAEREVLGVDTDGYRIRKVELWNDYGTKSTKQWAFIVEQQVTE